MSYSEIAKSLELLEKDWDIDSVIKDFHSFSGNVTGQIVQTVVRDKEDFL